MDKIIGFALIILTALTLFITITDTKLFVV
jgi:hypothetical protein